MLALVMLGYGFLGGFIAPYHVGKNSLLSMGTVLGIGSIIVGLLYFAFNRT